MDVIIEFALKILPPPLLIVVLCLAAFGFCRVYWGEIPKKELIRDRWFIGAFIAAALVGTMIHIIPWVKDRIPAFKAGESGIVVYALEGDKDGAALRGLRAILTQHMPQHKLVVRQKPRALDKLAAEITHHNAGLAIGGLVLDKPRVQLHLAVPGGKPRAVPVNLNETSQAWARIQAHLECPPADRWRVLFLNVNPDQPAASNLNADAQGLWTVLSQLGVKSDAVHVLAQLTQTNLAAWAGGISAADGERLLVYFKGPVSLDRSKQPVLGDIDKPLVPLPFLIQHLSTIDPHFIFLADAPLASKHWTGTPAGLLAAARVGQPIIDQPGENGLRFTPLLTKALAGSADLNGDGVVALHELHNLLQTRYKDNYGDMQTPAVIGPHTYLFRVPFAKE